MGIVFFELLLTNQTINGDYYIAQLDKLKVALEGKWPKLINQGNTIFLHYNASPHTALRTRQKLSQLEWEVLPHTPNSDYHLFRSLNDHFRGLNFHYNEEVKNDVQRFFSENIASFIRKELKSSQRGGKTQVVLL